MNTIHCGALNVVYTMLTVVNDTDS